MGSSYEYTVLKSGRFTGFLEDTESGRALSALLLPEPDRPLANGNEVRSQWHSESTDKITIRVGHQGYFVKRYNCQGPFYRFKNLLRPSRALRSWRNGLRFLQADLPTLPPVLCLEERSCGLLGRSYVVFPYLEQGKSLLESWPAMNGQDQRRLLLQLADIFGQMHRRGIFHGDLNWRNILLQRSQGGFKLYLVDLDGCRYRQGFRKGLASRDLAHFYRDMERADVTEEMHQLFTATWEAIALH